MTRVVLPACVGVLLSMTACSNPDGFKLADTNKDGKVSREECDNYMIKAIFAAADANGDGFVTLEEWRLENPDADPKKFAVADGNGDGKVTPAEARAHFEKEGTLTDLFKKIDANNDGFISREEAVAFRDKLAAQSEGTPTQKLKQATSQP